MFNSPKLSLKDILGKEYIEKIIEANEALGVMDAETGEKIGSEKVDFYPEDMQKKNSSFLQKVGTGIISPFENKNDGAATAAFAKALSKNSAPVTGMGYYRVGEDGRLYLIGKSEHYHTPLGHKFPAYALIDNARKLGILNATHNNTRGYVTRLCETRLVQSANGIDWNDEKATEKVLASEEHKVLNRVINLETGSLAVEAGVKMMLARFYKLSPEFPTPKYDGKVPVFFVMADRTGEKEANYHGTTTITQTFRGLWPDYYKAMENNDIYKVVPIMINDLDDFKEKIEKYNTGKYKTAGFLHEIILMNYGGIRLSEEFLTGAYELCEKYDTPTLVDEIQSCMWYKGMFLFRLYGLKPDFAIVGKGFPGGEYPASKIITTAEMDNLNQFGALVTNGQEELASLAYLITMTFVAANGDEIERIGLKFENGLKKIHEKYPETILKAEGRELLAALHFTSVDAAAAFAGEMKKKCIDASAQTYKVNCPPALLLKPPVIISDEATDCILSQIEEIIKAHSAK